MRNHWLDLVKKRLEEKSQENSANQFDRLREQGIINDQGEVTGQFHRWNAFLAITEVSPASNKKEIELFRCLKPVFGSPSGIFVDVPRNSIVDHLQNGKKIITANRDERLNLWKEGTDVHLTSGGFVRNDLSDTAEDYVGELPRIP